MQTLYLFFIVNILHLSTVDALLFPYTNTQSSLYCKHLQFSTANTFNSLLQTPFFSYTNTQPSLYCKHLQFSTANTLLLSYANTQPSLYCKHLQFSTANLTPFYFLSQTLNQFSTADTFYFLIQTLNQFSTANTLLFSYTNA